MWWSESLGRIELNITKATAARCSHAGDCESDVLSEMQDPKYRRQLAKLDPSIVAESLKEYGAWDDKELADHTANLKRLFWLACCDVAEEVRA